MPEPSVITSREELDRLIAASRGRPVVIFKHSLACGVSSSVWQTCRVYLEKRSAKEGVKLGLIEIQNAREVSRELAERTGVRHESPQALVLRDARVVWKASHWDISPESLARGLEAALARE